MRSFYIVSEEPLDVVTPEIPETKMPYGDIETARVVFSKTIEGAINILYDGEDDHILYRVMVYTLPPDIVPFTPSILQAPLTPITQEVWVLQSVRPIYIGKASLSDGKQIEIPYNGPINKGYPIRRWTYSFNNADRLLEKHLYSQVLSPPCFRLTDFSPFKELLRLNPKTSASILSFTMSEIEEGVVDSRIGYLRNDTRLDEFSGHVCYFSTESYSHPPLRWMQIISFEDLPEILRNAGMQDPIQAITDGLLKSNIRLTCNDPSFSFSGYHYIATQLDYNYQSTEERPPVKKNPNMEGTVCKHLIACFNWIHNNMTELVQMIYNQNAHLFVEETRPVDPKESKLDKSLFPEYFK